MVFDREEWDIIASDAPDVLLGVVSNVLLVSPAHGKAYHVCFRVPSAFFPFMRGVLKLTEEVAKKYRCMFYLEQSDGTWFFGVEHGIARDRLDLWGYKDLPVWASRARSM